MAGLRATVTPFHSSSLLHFSLASPTLPSHFQDFYPVFGMDVRSCLEYYKVAHSRTDWGRGGGGGGNASTGEEGKGEGLGGLAFRVQAAKEVIYKELTAQCGIKAFEGAR